jgi:hypothetical protein
MYALIETKKGSCAVSNLVHTNELFDFEFASDNLKYIVYLEAFDMIVDRETERYSETKMPFHTRHKDLGVEMHLFEGKMMPGVENYREVFKLENVGFLLALHSPYELPDHTNQYYTVSPNQSYLILVTPQLKTIDDTLLNVSPKV